MEGIGQKYFSSSVPYGRFSRSFIYEEGDVLFESFVKRPRWFFNGYRYVGYAKRRHTQAIIVKTRTRVVRLGGSFSSADFRRSRGKTVGFIVVVLVFRRRR